jgi:hypothetical protein
VTVQPERGHQAPGAGAVVPPVLLTRSGDQVKKEIAGQPVWLWAVGAAVVIGGYVYFTRRAAPASAGGQSGQGGGKSTSSTNIKEWIVQHQGGPRPKPRPKPKPPHKRHHRRRRHR